jgi:UDP-N-acetylglucosamine transferase subunit ALG13
MSAPQNAVPPRLLIAPLDWGLGHATRCIPVIRQVLAEGAEVFLAGEGQTATLLRGEFPNLPLLPLKGYRVQYAAGRWELIGKLLLQIPKIIDAMDEEHHWLRGAVAEYGFNGVISDNRYGLYSDTMPSAIITHQLLVKSGAGPWADRQLQKLHYGYIQSFGECWVPDVAVAPSLGGELSHPQAMPQVPTHYIGNLSRFGEQAATPSKHLLVLLSGPEPQRTLLEQSICDQLATYFDPVILVRGLPDSVENLSIAPNVRVYNHLPAAALETVIREAHLVIARTGYSTVMDLMRLQKRSILIPTPGQTEQEYLGEHLMQEAFALCLPQEKFRWRAALDLSATFPYCLPAANTDAALKGAVQRFLQKVQSNPANPPSSLNPRL